MFDLSVVVLGACVVVGPGWVNGTPNSVVVLKGGLAVVVVWLAPELGPFVKEGLKTGLNGAKVAVCVKQENRRKTFKLST